MLQLVTPLASIIALGYTAPGPGSAEELAAVDRVYGDAFRRSAVQLERSLVRAAPVTWTSPRIVRSEHYALRTVESRGYGLRRTRELEETLVRIQVFLASDFEPSTPFPVLLHPDVQSYASYGDAHSDARSSFFGGFYDPSNPGGAAAALHDENDTRERFFLTHAATQQYLGQAFPNVELEAAWTQGLGAYFQSQIAYRYFVDRYIALRDGTEGNGLIPLGELLGAGLNDYLDRGQQRLFQLAMLFVYLRHFHPETRSQTADDWSAEVVGPFEDYARRRVAGEDVASHPVHALLGDRLDELDAEMRDFEGW